LKRQQDLAKAQAQLDIEAQILAERQAQKMAATESLQSTSETIAVYLGRGGKLGTGSKRYRYDPNPAYAQAQSQASAAEMALAQQQQALEVIRQQIRSLGGVPAFATGGLHSGGMRLVGENGPELEVTGPARYYSAAETSSMMGGGMVDELRGLREEVAMLRAEARATAINTGRTQDIMKRITKNGESMIVSTDGEALEVTAP
jgi:multidrug efflux pump subunit AcrA (membrane-fusion protein)